MLNTVAKRTDPEKTRKDRENIADCERRPYRKTPRVDILQVRSRESLVNKGLIVLDVNLRF